MPPRATYASISKPASRSPTSSTLNTNLRCGRSTACREYLPTLLEAGCPHVQDLRRCGRGAGGRAGRRHDARRRRLRPQRHPGRPDRGRARLRRQGPHGGLQQHGRRRQGPRRADRSRPGPQGHRLLRRGEQAVRRAVPRRQAGSGVHPAGHARRAAPRRRRRHPGLLHQDRRRHPGRRRQAARGVRRRDLRPGARHHGRRRPGARAHRRHRRQPHLPLHRPELQPGGRHGRRRDRRRGRSIVEPGELDPDHIVTPGVFVQRLVQASDRETATSSPRDHATEAGTVAGARRA